ncbi:MAG: hypothetical protein MUF49_10855 [Oculatellaceae cyanobacterium Prado106]|jgi:hypothetical protein|nr:hypothetical protein [Oculatellaceae cyanobacterium Prado106]
MMKSLLFTVRFTVSAVLSSITCFAGSALSQAVPATLRQEMPYAEARQILLDEGWQAILFPGDRQITSTTEEYLINELGYSEFVACSGTGMGFCRAEFATADSQKLILITVDNQSGQEPTLYRWYLEENPES